MKLYVIGLGPGEQTQMTPKAMAAIAEDSKLPRPLPPNMMDWIW